MTWEMTHAAPTSLQHGRKRKKSGHYLQEVSPDDRLVIQVEERTGCRNVIARFDHSFASVTPKPPRTARDHSSPLDRDTGARARARHWRCQQLRRQASLEESWATVALRSDYRIQPRPKPELVLNEVISLAKIFFFFLFGLAKRDCAKKTQPVAAFFDGSC